MRRALLVLAVALPIFYLPDTEANTFAAATIAPATIAPATIAPATIAPATIEEPMCIDAPESEWPQTVHFDDKATSLPLAQVRLIGRLATGIVQNWVDKRNRGIWFECGIRYGTPREKDEAATRWAFHIVRAAEQTDVNPWGLAGTIANESNFDRCAIGYHPRKWAVKKNMLKKKRRTISYSADEVVSAYRSIAARKRWSTTGWDAGPCQMLSRFYPGSIEDMFTLLPGVDICAMEMKAREDTYHSNRGWRYWRGSETDWYDSRITHHARLLGARRDEI